MAVDAIRHHGRTIDIDAAEKSRARSLLASAGSFGEISTSLFVAGRHWELSTLVTRCGRNASWLLRCDGGGQPALYAANHAYGSSGRFPGGYDPSASRDSAGCVVLRIPSRHFPMVLALAADFRSHPKSGALTRRTRSASPAPARA